MPQPDVLLAPTGHAGTAKHGKTGRRPRGKLSPSATAPHALTDNPLAQQRHRSSVFLSTIDLLAGEC
ncbi:MAG: hypothetical protein WCT37_02200 [Patescibacteria group bacterium]